MSETDAQIRLNHAAPWLILDLPAPHRVLSWTLNRPGFVDADRLLWREVRDADLPCDRDAERWLSRALAQARLASAAFGAPPTFLTSRALVHATRRRAEIGAARVEAVATVGLSNAERVGARRADAQARFGTINVAAITNAKLSEAGLVEAMSIIVEARTAAIIDHGPMLSTGRATGTGTDCVAIAAPSGLERFAGLHTALGEALGRAVYDAVAAGARDWRATIGAQAGG